METQPRCTGSGSRDRPPRRARRSAMGWDDRQGQELAAAPWMGGEAGTGARRSASRIVDDRGKETGMRREGGEGEEEEGARGLAGGGMLGGSCLPFDIEGMNE